jgi:probable rRNA maturation factor
MKVNFQTKLKSKLAFDKQFSQKIIKQTAKILKISNKELTVLLVADQRIKTLNKQFRKKNKITDVLSFTADEESYLGEIIINYNQVKRQAKTYNQSIKEEYALLLIHGFLHLLGYDHEKKSDWQKMKTLENKLLGKLNH